MKKKKKKQGLSKSAGLNVYDGNREAKRQAELEEVC